MLSSSLERGAPTAECLGRRRKEAAALQTGDGRRNEFGLQLEYLIATLP